VGNLLLSWRITRPRIPARPRQRTGRVQGCEVFDADKVGSTIILRQWRPGDRFQPIGYSKATKLQDLFVNQHVPRELRHDLVIATTADGRLFWVEGQRMSESFKLDKSSLRGLKWSWQRIVSTEKGGLRLGRVHGSFAPTA
jgi:tRNA(Ile)-lysidine synthetase-like protein